jgi:small subunit ribosomal protein S17
MKNKDTGLPADKKIKTKHGLVTSNKMKKTVVVAVTSYRPHPLYRKQVKRVRKFKAHDETNKCGIGDIVRIVETRPLSKEKCWMVDAILSKGETT